MTLDTKDSRIEAVSAESSKPKKSFSQSPDATAISSDRSASFDSGVILLELADDDGAKRPLSVLWVVSSLLTTVLVHAWLGLICSYVIWDRISAIMENELDASVVEEEIEPEEKEFVLANPDDKEHEVRKVINATSVGQSFSKELQTLSPPELVLSDAEPILERDHTFDISEGMEIDETITIKGSTGEAIIQLESALDRVTHEISMSLQERKVFVIWLLDASGSLAQQRRTISNRLERIYGELDALEENGSIPRYQQPVISGVVTFGSGINFLTKSPTSKFADVKKAFDSIETDESGIERVFSSIDHVMNKWGQYRRDRQIMLITVTDEAGDDLPMLEKAISRCRRFGTKAYVIGPSAIFGRRKGYVPYIASDNKTYQIPVDLGPESAVYEQIDLPFWFRGPQNKYLSSGFGPYALSRLVSETGGIYFTTNMLTMKGLKPLGTFETEALKPFAPEYIFADEDQYERHLKKHPLRRAVVTAARLSRMNQVEGTPQMDIRVTPGNFRRLATDAQRIVARSQLMIENILTAFPKGIDKQLENEESLRWRMTFYLTRGRLLAQQVRCMEYNTALASLKQDLSPQDVGSTANHWIFKPSKVVNYAVSQKRSAKLAEEYLKKVVKNAPGTPWATLASRELQNPFGIRVIKRFIPPPKAQPQKKGKPKRRVLLAPDKPRPKIQNKKMKPKPVKLPKF